MLTDTISFYSMSSIKKTSVTSRMYISKRTWCYNLYNVNEYIVCSLHQKSLQEILMCVLDNVCCCTVCQSIVKIVSSLVTMLIISLILKQRFFSLFFLIFSLLRGHPILPNYPFCRIFLYLSYTLRILNSDYFLFYILITHLHSLFLKFHNSVTTVIQHFFSSFFRIIFTRHFSTLPSKQYSLLYYLSI